VMERWNKIIAEGSGSLFGTEVPQIEHEHDSANFGIWVNWPFFAVAGVLRVLVGRGSARAAGA
jgi:hypothetical protein